MAAALMQKDLIETVIDHVIGAPYASLDGRTVAMVKTLLVDTMGAAVAGSSAERMPELASLIRGWGGSAEANVLVYGDAVPASHAALMNGAMARAWDFDDVHEGGGGHLCASIIPTAFVLAQLAGRPIPGRHFVLAIAIATDLIARLRMAQTRRSGWVAETFAPFGVVAVASRLLGFDRATTLAAMGLAYAQCASNTQGTVDGALSVRLQQGLAAKSGVLAAQFAQIGFTGPTGILQGQFGFYPLYTRNEYDPQVVTSELGERYELNNTSLKPYPTCKLTHLPIAILAGMVKEHGIAANDIERITVHTNGDGYAKCASSPHKWRPRTVADAQFSIPITGAIAIKQGTVTLGDLTPATWDRPDIQALADRIEARVDPELEALPAMISPTVVELRTRAGAHIRRREDFVSGSPEKPMSIDEVSSKFLGCVAASARPISAAKAQRFLQMAQDVDSLADVRPLVDLLTGN